MAVDSAQDGSHVGYSEDMWYEVTTDIDMLFVASLFVNA